MGNDYIVHVGPVIVINNLPAEIVEKHNSCCNDKCKKFHKYGSGKFCDECGSPIAEWSTRVMGTRSIDLYELIGESITYADSEHQNTSKIVLVANLDIGNAGYFSFNLKYEPFDVFPKIEEVTDNIEKFKSIFKKELDKLKEIYGESNVEVKYGVVGTII